MIVKHLTYIFFSLFLFYWNISLANDFFDRAEQNHNFYSPIKTAGLVINSRGNINTIQRYTLMNKDLEYKIQNISSKLNAADLSKAQQLQACTYTDRGSNIIAEFKKNKNRWQLIRVFNRKNKNLSMKNIRRTYKLNESINCFPKFVNQWEKRHRKSKLRLINEESRVSNIFLVSNKIQYIANVNFQYIYPSKQNYINGWIISSINLNKTKTNKIINKPIPRIERSYFADNILTQSERISANHDSQRPAPLKASASNLICHNNNKERRVRIAFVLRSNVKIQSTMISTSNRNKLATFALGLGRAKISLNNCINVSIHDNNGLTTIDMRKFTNNVKGVKYGSGRKKNTSYIDYYY